MLPGHDEGCREDLGDQMAEDFANNGADNRALKDSDQQSRIVGRAFMMIVAVVAVVGLFLPLPGQLASVGLDG